MMTQVDERDCRCLELVLSSVLREGRYSMLSLRQGKGESESSRAQQRERTHDAEYMVKSGDQNLGKLSLLPWRTMHLSRKPPIRTRWEHGVLSS
eukprot:7366565-Prymnesium_polylepis.3